jgi:hypothetical protein
MIGQPTGSEVAVPLWNIITIALAIVAVLIPIVVFYLLMLWLKGTTAMPVAAAWLALGLRAGLVEFEPPLNRFRTKRYPGWPDTQSPILPRAGPPAVKAEWDVVAKAKTYRSASAFIWETWSIVIVLPTVCFSGNVQTFASLNVVFSRNVRQDGRAKRHAAVSILP